MTLCSAIADCGRCQKGATTIEYALIAGLVAIVLVPGLMWVRDWQEQVSQKLNAQLDLDGAAMIAARSDFREPVRDPRDHQGP